MQSISFYLQKYSKIGFKQENFKKCLIDAIKEVCDVDVEGKSVKITNNTIHVNAVGVFKSELFLHKDKIMQVFNQKIEERGGAAIHKKLI
jgi:hypothetical protein